MEKSGPRQGAEGVIEGVKGKAKVAVGAITSDDELKREGEAQQDKAKAQRDAATREAEAAKARAAAKGHETEQAFHQNR